MQPQQSLVLTPRLRLAPAAPGTFTFHSDFTDADYILNTNIHNQSAAEAYCNSQGGHLVSYASQYEQLEVENYYIGHVRNAPMD